MSISIKHWVYTVSIFVAAIIIAEYAAKGIEFLRNRYDIVEQE